MEESEYNSLYVFITLQISIFIGAFMFSKIVGPCINNYDDDEDDIVIF